MALAGGLAQQIGLGHFAHMLDFGQHAFVLDQRQRQPAGPLDGGAV